MRKWLRRIRGAIGIGAIWGAVWAAVGFVPRWVFGIDSDLPFSFLFGALGFISGVMFSGVLVLAEGRRRFHQMSLPRFAAWGAVGSLVLSTLLVRTAPSISWGDALAVYTALGVAGAVCASGSLALARRAVRRDLSHTPAEASLRLPSEPDGGRR
jgi:Mg/Co/Ni transporter MgtE